MLRSRGDNPNSSKGFGRSSRFSFLTLLGAKTVPSADDHSLDRKDKNSCIPTEKGGEDNVSVVEAPAIGEEALALEASGETIPKDGDR